MRYRWAPRDDNFHSSLCDPVRMSLHLVVSYSNIGFGLTLACSGQDKRPCYAKIRQGETESTIRSEWVAMGMIYRPWQFIPQGTKNTIGLRILLALPDVLRFLTRPSSALEIPSLVVLVGEMEIDQLEANPAVGPDSSETRITRIPNSTVDGQSNPGLHNLADIPSRSCSLFTQITSL